MEFSFNELIYPLSTPLNPQIKAKRTVSGLDVSRSCVISRVRQVILDEPRLFFSFRILMDFFQSLLLKGVSREDSKELGRGTFGIVYTVRYCQTVCAAKELEVRAISNHDKQDEMPQTLVQLFARECHQWNELRHPNIVQFLGVYFSASNNQLPALVTEMMPDSLTLLVKRYDKIPVCIKFSIVGDVSLGLCYLHNHDPPIIHHCLNPNSILLTALCVAKITDVGVYKMIKAGGRKITEVPGVVDFMPPEILADSVEYSPPVDVFSFAGIILHTFNQRWPHPCERVQYDSAGREEVVLSEIERRQQYLDEMQQEGELLKLLTEECLNDDPDMRPTSTAVCEQIHTNKTAYMKELSQDNVITYRQQVEELRDQKEQTAFNRSEENDQLKQEIDQLKSEIKILKSKNKKLKQQMVSVLQLAIYVAMCIASYKKALSLMIF